MKFCSLIKPLQSSVDSTVQMKDFSETEEIISFCSAFFTFPKCSFWKVYSLGCGIYVWVNGKSRHNTVAGWGNKTKHRWSKAMLSTCTRAQQIPRDLFMILFCWGEIYVWRTYYCVELFRLVSQCSLIKNNFWAY